MSRTPTLMIAAALALAAPGGGAALAQMSDPAVEAALNAGTVGEKADGYLGVAGAVPAEVRAKVEAINIKRREGYTQVAAQRNVTVREFAASIGCKTLASLKPGRAYSIDGESWSRRGAGPVPLPAYCG